jgi:sugar lactone lactonase YvrE
MNLKMFITAMLLVLLATFVADGATVTPVAPGLNAAIGQAYSVSDNSIYFVQYNSGQVSRFNLTTGSVTTIHSGLAFPEGIAMLPSSDVAYVTTRDGNLWKVHTTSADRAVVASGLGEPHAIVIDPSRFVAYVTDFGGGRVLRVDLGGSGARTTVVSGLVNPLGLLLSTDFNTAYIAEPNRILSVNLSAGTRTTLTGGLTNAFFMDWADDARNSIYYVERDPANRVSRLDLTTRSSTLIAPVSFRPSSVVRTLDPCTIYVASDTVIERVHLCSPGGPVITRLGHIPSTSINPVTGQATTDPSYFFRVKNASFGGSIHVMLDVPGMRSLGATYYKVMLDGSSDSTPEIASWVNHRWNGSTFVPQTVVPALGFYEVPSGLWAIPDLGFVLDSTRLTNGRHTLRVKLYDFMHFPIWWVPEAQVVILVDNEAPTVRIDSIEHDFIPLDECALITSGSTKLHFSFTAYDPQGQLCSYALTDEWGRDRSAPIASDRYIGVHDASPTWFGVSPSNHWHDLCSTSVTCAHAFTLTATGNTTNGYTYIHSSRTSDHVAVFLPGVCP